MTPTTPYAVSPYARKDSHGFGLSVLWNQSIQAARDATVCTCAHRGVSHGHGDDAGPAWPDGSRIGRGACGIDGCDCPLFEDSATLAETITGRRG